MSLCYLNGLFARSHHSVFVLGDPPLSSAAACANFPDLAAFFFFLPTTASSSLFKMIGGTKTLLHALPLLGAALAGTANAAPQRFQIPFGSKEHRGPDLTSEGEIDLSKYTIGQILNYTLHHRGPHDGEHGHHVDVGDEHRHPRGPPLFKLAYIVNRTESVR